MEADFFLSSVESKAFGDVRACRIIGEAVFEGTEKHALWVDVDPEVGWEATGSSGPTRTLLLTTRYKGDDIWNFRSFPLHVHIAFAFAPVNVGVPVVRVDEVRTLAWGELYGSSESASDHRLEPLPRN